MSPWFTLAVVVSGTTLLSEEPAEFVVACWPLGMFVISWSSVVSEPVKVELDVCVVEETEDVVLGREVELEVSVAVGGCVSVVVWAAVVVWATVVDVV